jgi:hypothetical protein
MKCPSEIAMLGNEQAYGHSRRPLKIKFFAHEIRRNKKPVCPI